MIHSKWNHSSTTARFFATHNPISQFALHRLSERKMRQMLNEFDNKRGIDHLPSTKALVVLLDVKHLVIKRVLFICSQNISRTASPIWIKFWDVVGNRHALGCISIYPNRAEGKKMYVCSVCKCDHIYQN